jgi:hypothetical protein
MKPLDIRDISIIDAFPVYGCNPTWKTVNFILNVGCGEGRIDRHVHAMGYFISSTDIKEPTGDKWPSFSRADIFDLSSFPVKSAPIVICSQVLEHLKDWAPALRNLIELTEIRLIITVPYKRSFYSREHVNFWDDTTVGIFKELCFPYSVAISKIRTKPEDVERKQWCYLIVVDKRQKYGA